MKKLLVLTLVSAATALQAQTAAANPPLEFEVAVIKPTVDHSVPGLIVHMAGERGYHGVNMPLLNYFMIAYQIRADQITGPDWLSTDNFDMEGKGDRSYTGDELHTMLQNLLLDRFHVKMHRETRETAGYNLVVDTGGPKLTEHDPSDYFQGPMFPGPGRHEARNVTMQYFVFLLSQATGQKVIDKTGLTGHYDFVVTWGAENMGMVMMPMASGAMPPQPPVPEGPQAAAPGLSIPEALRKQLGLRLDKAKVPAEHIVIDHIEKLAEN